MARPVEVEGQSRPLSGGTGVTTPLLDPWNQYPLSSLSKSAEPERREGETDERRERLGEMGVRLVVVDVLVRSASGKTLVFIELGLR